ncbi:hypothetical protein [Haliangium sp.]|uniref:hypothetical protein n=1 Tax=Haliangium sp. TaxID=2663208 RepID=UPI003D133572
MSNRPNHSASRRLTCWLVALAVLVAPLAVAAQPADAITEARQNYQNGKAQFDAGDYEGAILSFETANRLSPSPVLHFNIGLAHERLGNQSEALAHFKAYLQAMPNAANRELVEIKISRLESELGGGAPTPAPATPAPFTPAPVTPTPAAPTPAAPAPASPTPATPPAPAVAATTTPPGPAEAAPATSTGDPQLDRVAAIDVSAIRDRRAPLMAAAAPRPAPAPEPEKPTTPAYKQVWFWVVVGVAAIILIDVAAGGGSDSAAQSNGLSTPAAGPTLLRF